ncbi:MAG: fumarylacetoacetate hydrolase family protein, partial [Phycisphaerales bacterium]
MSTPERYPLVGLDPSFGATVGIHLPGGEVMPIRHIIGVGRNYKAHAEEQGAAVPDRPMLFTKNPASACLSGEPIRIPRVCTDRQLTGAAEHGEREQVLVEVAGGEALGQTAQLALPRLQGLHLAVEPIQAACPHPGGHPQGEGLAQVATPRRE